MSGTTGVPKAWAIQSSTPVTTCNCTGACRDGRGCPVYAAANPVAEVERDDWTAALAAASDAIIRRHEADGCGVGGACTAIEGFLDAIEQLASKGQS